MTIRHFLSCLALAAIAIGAPVTAQQSIPQLGIDRSGSCRNFSIYDPTKPGTDKMVPIACVDTTTHVVKQPSVAITGGTITGITDLAVADGGTGASTASAARTNLGLGTAATVDTGTSGATLPLLNGVNSWGAPQTFSALNLNSPSSMAIGYISSAAGQASAIGLRTNTTERWRISKNATAEGGSNAGSDWQITAYDDSGTYLRANFIITRSSGEGIFDGAFRPATDNARALGTASNRWSNIYGATITTANAAITGGNITGITDLAVADGGTGASDATGARSNLGLGSMATQDSAAVSISGGSVTGVSNLQGVRTITVDSNFPLDPRINPFENIHIGTLTANRAIALNTVNAVTGDRFKIVRTGGGGFTLSVGGLKALAQNTWAIVTFVDGAWVLTGYGAL